MTIPQKVELSKVVSLIDLSKKPATPKKVTETITTITAMVTPFDYDDYGNGYTWAEIREKLGLNSNVANAKWMPLKLMPLFANLSAPPILTTKGRPTKFGAQMLSRYKTFVIDGGKDYELFCEQVRSEFSGDSGKLARVEVLENDYDGDDNPSSLARFQRQVEDKAEDLESKIVLVLQSKQQADQVEIQYQQAVDESWQQQVIADELAKFQKEQERKKQETELRLKIRQMLESQS